jgi:signal transduction histidine kinase
LRRRLLGSYLVLVAVILLGLEVPLGILFARHERSNLEAEVTRNATALAGVAEQRLNSSETGSAQSFEGLAQAFATRGDAEVTLYGADGVAVVARSMSETDDRDPPPHPGVAAALAGHASVGPQRDDGRDWTYAAAPVTSGGTTVGAVVFARPDEETNERIATAWLLLGGLAVIVLGVTAAVGWRMARWLSAPLTALTDAAAEVGSGRLDVRAPEDKGPAELRGLAAQFNDMVGRIDELIGAQQRFVADASHQLRTPLTALRLRIENLESSGRDPAAIEAALDEADRLGRLLDGLLALGRAEGVRAEPKRTDVRSVVAERCDAWVAFAEEQGAALESGGSANGTTLDAMVIPGHLEQILDNLIANSVEAVDCNSSIVLSAWDDPAGVVVEVADDGPGMTTRQREHAFDRFWQGGSGSDGRAGLGLAIVHQLVIANHGRIELLDTPGGGLTARVHLPPASPTQHQSAVGREP